VVENRDPGYRTPRRPAAESNQVLGQRLVDSPNR
jgi:hypothetical protein